jgi:hypothetical protein
MQSILSKIFNYNVELNIVTQEKIALLEKPAKFFSQLSKYMSQVFVRKKDYSKIEYVFIIFYLSLFLKAPQSVATMVAEVLERTEFHYGFLGPLKNLIKLLDLSELGYQGVRIGLFGRLNGRDRKFKYYINFGRLPALRSAALRVYYGRAQSIPRYGAVHVHV